MSQWFDELGGAYARRYAEINEARTIFEEQRLGILKHLVGGLRETWPDLPDVPVKLTDDEWLWLEHKDGAYRRAREQLKRSGSSFIGLSLGSPKGVPNLDGAFAFVPVVYFSMGGPMQRRIPPSFRPDLQRWRSTGMNFSRGAMRFGDQRFGMDVLEKHVRELPEIFRDVDEQLAKLVSGSDE